MPALRIVDPTLWGTVRQRQISSALASNGDKTQTSLNGTHRRKFVLSGLLRCVACGGAYMVMAKDRYGCAVHVKSGTCGNGSTTTPSALERRVLDALRDKMMAPDVIVHRGLQRRGHGDAGH